MATDIFDRLFKLTKEDLAIVRSEINTHIAACRACVLERPPNYGEALIEANKAYAFAVAENLQCLEPMINFYRAHCYQGLRNWDKAFSIYTSGTIPAVDRSALQDLSRRCLDMMMREARNDPKKLRRVYAKEDLHQRFFCHGDQAY